MQHRARRGVSAPIALATVLWCAATGAGAQTKNPTLAGTWKLSAEKSGPAGGAQKGGRNEVLPVPEGFVTRQRGSSGAPARGGSRGAGDSSGATRSAGGRGGESGGPEGRSDLGPLMTYARPLPMIVILETDSTISISDPSGHPRTYRPNGRKEIEPLIGADTLEITAKWKGGKLTLDRKLGSFGTIHEVYSIDPETHELIVEARLTAPQPAQPIDLRRVYEPGS